MWPDSSAPLRELNGPDDTSSGVPDVRHPLAVLAELAPLLNGPPRHFYLTKDHDRLPEYGSHVISMLLEEERCKVPAYALQVGNVIRNMSDSPYLGFRPRPSPPRLIGVSLFEYARDHALRMRSRMRVRHEPPQVVRHPRILRIPLGYQSQHLMPQKPMAQRTLDTFFAGDIATVFPVTIIVIGFRLRRRSRGGNCGVCWTACAVPANGTSCSVRFGRKIPRVSSSTRATPKI